VTLAVIPENPVVVNRIADVPPLAGFTVGITAARRAEELATMLERRGAVIQQGAALRIVALADDTELQRATRELIAQPPDIVVTTTGN
jgi:uroporphyrinogen-III synthase